jgi:plastocyanin
MTFYELVLLEARAMNRDKGMRRVAMGVMVAVAVLGAACASKAPGPAAGGSTTSPTASSGTGSNGGNAYGGTGGYGRSGGGSASTSPTPASGTIQQGAGGALVFAPTSLTVTQGEKLTVVNVGSAAHTFTITGHGIDVVNNPGQQAQVAIELAPGTYQFICRFHVGSGMKGTLVVTG